MLRLAKQKQETQTKARNTNKQQERLRQAKQKTRNTNKKQET